MLLYVGVSHVVSSWYHACHNRLSVSQGSTSEDKQHLSLFWKGFMVCFFAASDGCYVFCRQISYKQIAHRLHTNKDYPLCEKLTQYQSVSPSVGFLLLLTLLYYKHIVQHSSHGSTWISVAPTIDSGAHKPEKRWRGAAGHVYSMHVASCNAPKTPRCLYCTNCTST